MTAPLLEKVTLTHTLLRPSLSQCPLPAMGRPW